MYTQLCVLQNVNMNGEIPSVPITTLAGISSLTDLLPELPLPSPVNAGGNKSLLFHPKIGDEARKVLSSHDGNLVSQLVRALQHTTTDHIELKDSLVGDSIEGDIPVLLKAILAHESTVFRSGSNLNALNNGGAITVNGGSPSMESSPSIPAERRRNSHKTAAVSPARASESENCPKPDFMAAGEPISTEATLSQKEKFSAKSRSHPVVLLEPLSSDVLRDANLSEDGRKRKHRSFGHYNVVSSKGSENKLTLKLSKAKPVENHEEDAEEPSESKGIKRLRSEDDEVPEVPADADYECSLTERVKRRRRQVGSYREQGSDGEADSKETGVKRDLKRRSGGDDGDDDPDFVGTEDDKAVTRTPGRDKAKAEEVAQAMAEAIKKKREKRKQMSEAISTEAIMETNTYKRFLNLIDGVLETAENVDPADLNIDDEDDEDTGLSEAIITKSVLSDLCDEAAKLKSIGGMNQISCEKLIKLLTILHHSIKDGCKVNTLLIGESDDSREEYRRELAMERVLTAVDAALTALYIMTSLDMPKEVYIEDIIEKIVTIVKNQMQKTIFPAFDPVYKDDPKSKGGYSGSMKMKRSRAYGVRNKSTLMLYNKLTEVVDSVSDLIFIQELTDTIILKVSALSLAPFFVENISEMQLDSLKLVTNVFAHYEKHRQLIIEDILASLARLPSSKKNLRNYRLNADEQIQMVTALTLQLIQCVVKLPKPNNSDEKVDDEVIIVTSYETAMRTAHNFLSVFLKKCSTKGEEDYRPLFENFVQDLLSTVNKPEWPAAELLLSLLGRLLVQQFSNKSVDMSLRVASLDYLGIVAARLRKDAVSIKLNKEMVTEVIAQIKSNEEEESTTNTRRSKQKKKPEMSRTEYMQKALLEYLVHSSENDPSLVFARQYYIGQWYRDSAMEVDKVAKKLEQKAKPAGKDKKKRKEEEVNEEEEDENKTATADELEKMKEGQQDAEKRKTFLLMQAQEKVSAFAVFKGSLGRLDYENACFVSRYLASNRPFSQSFDIYLTQILKVLCETSVQVRTKAMKCLTAVVEADPSILARPDMQRGVHGRLLDQSTSVREAAVELVGKFILIRPELTAQYYDMLSERILDTGISVRKRVIKIFRDICLEQPEFPKIPEMCVKMLRRVNDEEGIKKLVNDTFQNMWFTPKKNENGKDQSRLVTLVMNITDVVSACRETGYEWFEVLLDNLLKKEKDSESKPCMKACLQLISCLVENVLTLEEGTSDGKSGSSPRIVSCFSTLFLFCKVKPELLISHCTTIQPYLDIKCNTPADYMLLHNVARILELSVPLMEHPAESFLAQIEEDMMKLVLRHGMMVLQSCVSCLGSVVNNVTHNYKLVRDCFQKFFGVLSMFMSQHQKDPQSTHLVSNKPTLLRSLYTVGLMCRHFDFDSNDFGEKKVSIRERVYDVLMYFIQHEDGDVRHKALTGLGFFVTRHYEFMLLNETKELYQHLLTDQDVSEQLCCQVLRNLQTYLTEEEERMVKADADWNKLHDKENLKEMGDIQSGMASTIIQVYLKSILESFFHAQQPVRSTALNVTILILKQGLVHPVQCLPYLGCMGSDAENQFRIKADQQLKEIDKKYPGFIQMKAMQGVKMSYRLQTILQQDPAAPVRGYRTEVNKETENISYYALNNFIYSLIRGNRSQRRALISTMLNMFDDSSKVPLSELLYMADNLAYFPYQTQEEPLYIMHQIDILVSVSGPNIIQSFRDIFYLEASEGKKLDDDEDEDIEVLLAKVPDDISPLQELYMASQGCILLLMLKQHLKEAFGFTDNKIQRYSPTDAAKVWEKQTSRKQEQPFTPKQVLDVMSEGPLPKEVTEDVKTELLQHYLDFKQLMLSIDPDDEDDEDLPPKPAQPTTEAGSSEGNEPAPDDKPDNEEATETNKSTPVSGKNKPVDTKSPVTSTRKSSHRQSINISSERKRSRHRSSQRHHKTPNQKNKHRKKKKVPTATLR